MRSKSCGEFSRLLESLTAVEVAPVFPSFPPSQRHFRTLCLVATTWVVLLLAAPWNCRAIGAGQTPGVANEYDLKLARLFATSKFISWPDETVGATAPFVIGVIDPGAFREGLQKLTTRKRTDRPIRVETLKSVTDSDACYQLFIPTKAKSEIVDSILEQTANQPVLVWRDEADSQKTTGVACTVVQRGDALMIEADASELKRHNRTPNGTLCSLNLVRVVKPAKLLALA